MGKGPDRDAESAPPLGKESVFGGERDGALLSTVCVLTIKKSHF